MKKEIKFIFTFLIVASFLYFIFVIFYSKNLPVIGTSGVAFTLNKILNFMGMQAYIVDDTIYLPNNNRLSIIVECTGLYEMIMLGSIIISYPTTIIKKLYGVVFGIIILYILNMLRLVSISYVLVYYAEKFFFIDRYLWQISLVIFISLTYTMWLKSIERFDSLSY